MNLPDGCRVVECNSIGLEGKDMIEIKHEKDFAWLLRGDKIMSVLKMNNTYYIVDSDVCYIFIEKGRGAK
jgi:hypothetical protein